MYVSVGKIHDFLSKGSRSDERKTTRSQKGTICVVLLNAFDVIEFHYNILIVIHRKVFNECACNPQIIGVNLRTSELFNHRTRSLTDYLSYLYIETVY